MARKIKFALEMADGAKVRGSIEELREHFDLEKAVGYFLSGKLVEWLEDRFYEDEAEAVEAIDKDAPDLRERLCEALGVPYEGDSELDVEALERLNEKKAILRQKTGDEEIIAHAAQTAFNQEDLADLLEMDEPVIYLCGEKFNIPARVKNKKYIGILGTPTISIKANSQKETDAKGIVFENVKLPWGDVTETNENTIACGKCGKKNPSAAKFCNSCGAQLNVDKATLKEEPVVSPQSTSNNKIKSDLMEIKESLWGTRDIWQILARNGSPSNKSLSDLEKKIFIKYVCNGNYKEEDLIHIFVYDDMSAGWAFTTDAFCVAGIIQKYFNGISFSGMIDRLHYKDINSIEIDDDEPEETNILYINGVDYKLNCHYLGADHNIHLSEHTLWQMARFLDLARFAVQ